MITYIDIKKICPHPSNPRKHLGDLTELAESIKTSGILQNLTVVPMAAGFCSSCSLYIPGAAKCEEDYDKNERPPCSKWQSNGNYTAGIGHRRLAAAKLGHKTVIGADGMMMSIKKCEKPKSWKALGRLMREKDNG